MQNTYGELSKICEKIIKQGLYYTSLLLTSCLLRTSYQVFHPSYSFLSQLCFRDTSCQASRFQSSAQMSLNLRPKRECNSQQRAHSSNTHHHLLSSPKNHSFSSLVLCNNQQSMMTVQILRVGSLIYFSLFKVKRFQSADFLSPFINF